MPDLKILIFQIVLILVVSRCAGVAFRLIRQPKVVAEMFAGILLGPSALGIIFPRWYESLFAPEGLAGLYALSDIGLLFFIFLVGLQSRNHPFRLFSVSSIVVSFFSMVTPFVLGGLLAVLLHNRVAGRTEGSESLPVFILFVAAAMSITAFPVLARILSEQNLLNTRLGAIAISCAAVDDVTAWSVLAVVLTIVHSGHSPSYLFLHLAMLLGYATIMIFGVRPLLARFPLPRFLSADGMIAFILITLLSSSWVTESLGAHSLIGAFIAGLVMPKADDLLRRVQTSFESVTVVFFLPLFFALTGLRTRVTLLNQPNLWLYCGLIILVAVAGKLLGCAFAMRKAAASWREAFAVGALVNTRGLVELVILNVGLELKIISPTLFSMMVIMALTTTLMTAPLLRWTLGSRENAVASKSDQHSSEIAPAFIEPILRGTNHES